MAGYNEINITKLIGTIPELKYIRDDCYAYLSLETYLETKQSIPSYDEFINDMVVLYRRWKNDRSYVEPMYDIVTYPALLKTIQLIVHPKK